MKEQKRMKFDKRVRSVLIHYKNRDKRDKMHKIHAFIIYMLLLSMEELTLRVHNYYPVGMLHGSWTTHLSIHVYCSCVLWGLDYLVN